MWKITTVKVRENEEIDLAKFFRFLLDKKKLVSKYAISFFLFGVLLSLSLPIKYESEIVLLVENKKSDWSPSGLLGGLTGLKNLGKLTGSQDEIPAKLYPFLVGSYAFLDIILKSEVKNSPNSEPAPVKDYLERESGGSILETIKKYTIGGGYLDVQPGSDIVIPRRRPRRKLTIGKVVMGITPSLASLRLIVERSTTS